MKRYLLHDKGLVVPISFDRSFTSNSYIMVKNWIIIRWLMPKQYWQWLVIIKFMQNPSFRPFAPKYDSYICYSSCLILNGCNILKNNKHQPIVCMKTIRYSSPIQLVRQGLKYTKYEIHSLFTMFKSLWNIYSCAAWLAELI